MKIRIGFVSNSSSSSFIVGIAKISDIAKCRKYIEDNKINDDVEIFTFKELKDKQSYSMRVRKGHIDVESFTGACAIINTEDMKDEDYVLTYYFCGNEGDHAFQELGDEDPWDCDLNYDMVHEEDFFEKEEEDVFVMFASGHKAGLGHTSITYGADRNG